MHRSTHLHLIYLLLSTLATVWGCRKDKEEFHPYVPTQEDLGLLLSQAPDASSHTVFQFGGSIPDTTLTTASGVRVFLADTENLFADDTGAPVPCSTCPNLKVEVTNVLSEGDLIARGMNTESAADSKMLESVGVVYLKVSCKGKPLALLPNRYVKVQIPASDIKNSMHVFTGAFNDQDEWLGWTDTNSPAFWAEWPVPAPGTAQTGYEVILPQLGWNNCARPLTEQTSSFCVTLPDQFTALNTRVFLVFENVRAIAELKGTDNGSQFCFEEAPIGFTVDVVAISKTGGQYWVVRKPWETGNQVQLPLTPQPVTEQEVLAVIKSL